MLLSKVISKFDKNPNTVYVNTFESPVGTVTAAADEDYLYIVIFEDSKNFQKCFDIIAKELSCKFVLKENKLLQKFENELSEYFNGKLKKFTIPVKTFGSDLALIFPKGGMGQAFGITLWVYPVVWRFGQGYRPSSQPLPGRRGSLWSKCIADSGSLSQIGRCRI